jgi:MFS family permease
MTFQKKLLGFYLITSLGLSIISLATFLNIEIVFHSISYLGIALSLRTLSSCILGYKANYLIQKININNSFILSFVFGMISIFLIFLGFHYHNFLLLLLGVILIGLPITLTTILLTITLRIASDNNSTYRQYSGSRELIFGFSRLFACLFTPILLLKIGINNLISVNAVIYLIGLALFVGLDLKRFANEKIPNSFIKMNHLILKSKDTWIFICQTIASLSLIALIPLLASSDQISLTKEFPPLLRQSLWSVEAFTMILSSIIYLLAKRSKDSETVKAILMLNSAFLFLFLFFRQPIVTIIIVMLISITIMLAFYIFRDDYVIAAENDTRLIEAHAAFSSVIKDLICSISPVVLSYLLINFRLDMAILSILSFQLTLYIGYVFLTKNRVNKLQEDVVIEA